MHVLPPALAFALGLALAGDGPPQAAPAMAAGAAGPLLVLLVAVAAGEWETTCARASLVRTSAVGA